MIRHCVDGVSKKLFDYVIGFVVTVIAFPLMLLIGIVIYASEPGSFIVFEHLRIGKDGKAFRCYKFRTMYSDDNGALASFLQGNAHAKEEWNKNRKLKSDPRVTHIGAILRKYSLDELPQLFNVLKGEMSLVGPRPVTSQELANYYGDNATIYYRVKPGITGLWQVSGRNNLSYAKRVELDCWYVNNWSLWLDVKILLKTIGVVLSGEGAY